MTPDELAKAEDLHRERLLKIIPLRNAEPLKWGNVRGLGIDELGGLGIDAKGILYWHGKRVEIRKRLTLSVWQRIGAAAVVAATVSMGVTDLFRFLWDMQ